MIKELQNKIDACKVISFDIFDTLIHRLVIHPRDVYQLMEHKLRYTQIVQKYPVLTTSFALLRREAETVARNERDKYEGDRETTFSEIYDVFAELAGVPRSVIQELQKIELITESELIYADFEIKEAFEYAIQQNKKVIVISDMYHNHQTLQSFLERVGYTGFDKIPIYVSCDHRVSKENGRLYDKVLIEYKASDILHVGDNSHADIEVAERKGINTYFRDMNLVDEACYPLFLYDSSFTTSIVRGILRKLYLEKPQRSIYNSLGISVLGPLMSGFAIWIISSLLDKKYDQALFFARDGYLLHQMIDKHMKDCEDSQSRIFTKLPPLKYVYISRSASALPAFFDFNLNKLPRIASGQEARSVREWLKLYGLSNTIQYRGQIQQAGFASEESLSRAGDEKMPLLLSILYKEILDASCKERKDATEYFNTFKNKKIAIIDLGWLGSLQQNFSKLVNLQGETTTVDGYYFNLWTHESFSRKGLHDNFFSYLNTHRIEMYANLPKLLQRGGVSLLERLTSAPHGTTLQYLNGQPVLDEIKENETIRAILSIQEGVIEFFDALVPLLKTMPISSFSSLDWSRSFFRMIEFPTLQEAALLGDLLHSDNAGTEVLVPFAPKVDEETLKNKTLYNKAKERAYWKQGFKVRNKRVEKNDKIKRN